MYVDINICVYIFCNIRSMRLRFSKNKETPKKLLCAVHSQNQIKIGVSMYNTYRLAWCFVEGNFKMHFTN